jgi:hypothetical protein
MLMTPRGLFSPLEPGTAVAGVTETVTAVDRAVAPGPERNHRFVAALGAYDGVHFPGAAVVTATTALLGPAAGPAGLTPLGVVNKTAGVEEFLLPHREYELAVAVHTG